MESDRSDPKPAVVVQGSQLNSAGKESAAPKRRTGRPDRGRQMIPFFSNEEVDTEAYFTLPNGPSKSSRRRRRPGRPSNQDSSSSSLNGHEVGFNTLPIGQLSFAATEEHPINIDLSHLKGVKIEVSRNAKVVELSDKMREYKCEYDKAAKKLGSSCTISTSVDTVCSPEDDDTCNNMLPSTGSYFDNAGTPSQNGHTSRRGGAAPTMREKARQLVNFFDTYSNMKKDACKLNAVKPSRKPQTNATAATAYAFPRYVRSPDPSSIPVPGSS